MILIPYLVSVVPLLEVALAFTTPHQFPRDRDCIAMNDRTAEEVIAHLNLIPNTPEKGYFAETFRDDDSDSATNRSRSTAIYYLLEGSAGHSVWHRLDAAEVWHYYAGAPLTLSVWSGEEITEVVLGPDVFRDEKPQAVVKKGEWQSARSEGDWTLVGTTVAPGFDPAGAEFADPEWTPQSQKSS